MTRPLGRLALLVALGLAASCGDDDGGATDAQVGPDGQVSPDAAPTDAGPGADAAPLPDGAADDAGACPAADLGARLGQDRFLIGGSMSDEAFAAAPYDLRYQYVAGAVPAGGPCASCATGCTVEGTPCDNTSGGCAWWGCWQWDQEPPGRFVASFLADAAAAGAIPMITLYIWYSVAGYVESTPELDAMQDSDRMADYLADFRFLCQVMAEDPTIPALLHLEPDLWGYGHQASADPTQVPVALAAAGAAECAGLGDHLAGFARCLGAIARAEAPNVLIGFHASAWGAGIDAIDNADPQADVAGHAAATADYLRALGADQADLVVVEMSDRDAGFNDRWWDATNATLPSFTQAIGWVQAMSSDLGLAPLWWQVPYGHLGLPNTCDQYEDNRVDYVLDHAGELAAGGALGVAFGAGATCQTTPDTDGGHFTTRASAYFSGDPPALCGPP
jgi:hypothetical protein